MSLSVVEKRHFGLFLWVLIRFERNSFLACFKLLLLFWRVFLKMSQLTCSFYFLHLLSAFRQSLLSCFMISAFLHRAQHLLQIFLDLSGAALLILSNRRELKRSDRSLQLLLSNEGNKEDFTLRK